MNEQDRINYYRIAEAIGYIRQKFKDQPGLDEIAGKIQVSPFHFQRIFTEWAGVSPKKFLQYTRIEYAKSILKERTLTEVAQETGLSGTGRLHDLFITIEGMTPGEYRNGGEKLRFNYSFAGTPFGKIIMASTVKGLSWVAFEEDEEKAFADLKNHFPKAVFSPVSDSIQQDSLARFQTGLQQKKIKLHVPGTGFQIKVWEALLKIPPGELSTYSHIASAIENSGAVRAVGTAIGSNPVAFIIPCHRVIRSDGDFGHYHWGTLRKTMMIGWEAARKDSRRKI